ncbi:hypothetical protein B0I33_104332 [Prauserella shujinwangii]|uniref:Uncharacterized protein n=1 Tax=Prauserella shujinwangii TaxID=1453103 RepID=A0A2T0LWW0_9PSEU|nr:hypothetical protein B0I33_104332 [Prauserella shujinwangii]
MTEPETMAELIADCAGIPRPQPPGPRTAREPAHPWRVDEACHAQVADLDEYV